jgi:hypothetical protein
MLEEEAIQALSIKLLGEAPLHRRLRLRSKVIFWDVCSQHHLSSTVESQINGIQGIRGIPGI